MYIYTYNIYIQYIYILLYIHNIYILLYIYTIYIYTIYIYVYIHMYSCIIIYHHLPELQYPATNHHLSYFWCFNPPFFNQWYLSAQQGTEQLEIGQQNTSFFRCVKSAELILAAAVDQLCEFHLKLFKLWDRPNWYNSLMNRPWTGPNPLIWPNPLVQQALQRTKPCSCDLWRTKHWFRMVETLRFLGWYISYRIWSWELHTFIFCFQLYIYTYTRIK
jgi:hypothetical protein